MTKIAFCHNVYNRFDCLLDTIKIEKELFPNSISIVAFNDVNPSGYISKQISRGVEYHSFPGKTHKIGCANGCTKAIVESYWHFPEVVIFSHDDVRISDKTIVQKNIELITSGQYDAVVRKPCTENNSYGDNYYMMEVFMVSGRLAADAFSGVLFENEYDIPKDCRGSISPEVFLYNKLKNLKVYEHKYDHKLEGYNQTLNQTMGYFHENIGERGWKR